MQRELVAVQYPALHEETRQQGTRNDHLMSPKRGGLVRLETSNPSEFDAATVLLERDARLRPAAGPVHSMVR